MISKMKRMRSITGSPISNRASVNNHITFLLPCHDSSRGSKRAFFISIKKFKIPLDLKYTLNITMDSDRKTEAEKHKRFCLKAKTIHYFKGGLSNENMVNYRLLQWYR